MPIWIPVPFGPVRIQPDGPIHGGCLRTGAGQLDDVDYGNYFVADASGFVRFGRENRHRLTLRVENIFNKEYATRWNRTSDAEGNYFLYNQYGLPLSVVIGYTYTF